MDRKRARQKAEALVSEMTLEEKASQLCFDAPAIERLGIPAYNWWNEALHGVARAGTATVFPQAIGLAAAFDTDLMADAGAVIATEGRAKYNAAMRHGDRDIYKGLTFWAPNVNIFRDPRWGRGHETYGEDPVLTARLAVPFIKGIQGEGEFMKAAACAKHFAVHSGPEAVRHEFNAVASLKDMEETYLPAFRACVQEAGVEAVMGAYNRTNGEPCCASPALMKRLREDWGFEGHFVSDCWAIRDFHEHHKVTGSMEESAAMALNAGCDVNCGCSYRRLMDAYEAGLVTEETITASCIRLFTTRYLLGLFEDTEYDRIPFTAVSAPEHVALAGRAARESIVMLKNDGILPLDRSTLKTIAVIGPNADSRAALIGNYHGTASRYVTVLEGIQDAAGKDVRVLYSQGSDLWRATVEALADPVRNDRLAEALAAAEIADVVIFVGGLDETLEGEEGDTGNAYSSGDKKDLLLPRVQRDLLHALLDLGKPVVVVNMTGSSVDLAEAQDKAGAVLQAWYPGQEGGRAVADILFGTSSPSGKLPVTFYRTCDDLPDFTNYSMKGRTYRYYDGEPLYPFGFGLTYGNTLATSLAVQADGAGARVAVTVKNEGTRDTEDVLQIYVRGLLDPWAPPHPSLAAFKRVLLRAGEVKRIEVELPAEAFTSVDDKGVRAVRSQRFEILAGFSQPDPRSEALTGHGCVRQVLEG